MKKELRFLFPGLFLMIMAMFYFTPKAVSQNQWGGVCCDHIYTTCHHPIGMDFEDATWVKEVEVCPIQ